MLVFLEPQVNPSMISEQVVDATSNIHHILSLSYLQI